MSNTPQFGLCCIFANQPIKFCRTTAKSLLSINSRNGQLAKLDKIILSNIDSLMMSLTYCHYNDISSFRITSDLFPLMSHPQLHYELFDLPSYNIISTKLYTIKQYAMMSNIRLVLHPDQFVVLNTPSDKTLRASLDDLAMHNEIARNVGVDTVIIHGGGVYGDKRSSLCRLYNRINELPSNIKNLLAIENDDRSYTPSDLLPICQELSVPMVYDVHHHRCNPDGLSVEDATRIAMSTWIDRKPLFHLSSPRDGWHSKNPRSHHDYIDIADWPQFWNGLNVTIEVEAKAKELAIKQLQTQLWK